MEVLHPSLQGLLQQQIQQQSHDLLSAEIMEEIVAGPQSLPQKLWQEAVEMEMAACVAPSIAERLCFRVERPALSVLAKPSTECMCGWCVSVLPSGRARSTKTYMQREVSRSRRALGSQLRREGGVWSLGKRKSSATTNILKQPKGERPRKPSLLGTTHVADRRCAIATTLW